MGEFSEVTVEMQRKAKEQRLLWLTLVRSCAQNGKFSVPSHSWNMIRAPTNMFLSLSAER
jgi:hypothetical protein